MHMYSVVYMCIYNVMHIHMHTLNILSLQMYLYNTYTHSYEGQGSLSVCSQIDIKCLKKLQANSRGLINIL